MDRDSLSLTLIAQYKAEIEELLVESEHIYRSTIDYELLDLKVEELLRCAKIDGINEKVIWDILQSRIPTYVNYVNYKTSGKKVA